MMTADDEAEMERLKQLRRARAGKPGWKANVAEIDRRIAAMNAKAAEVEHVIEEETEG